ncbi:hypothetical protein GYMLUDRAFT_36154 [Collybiopsis luxurians FD-317 M1]|nr:hypothetical protein GYMLUDRAFT_36154 [Collybiopsis luxurians FD-317 M1]
MPTHVLALAALVMGGWGVDLDKNAQGSKPVRPSSEMFVENVGNHTLLLKHSRYGIERWNTIGGFSIHFPSVSISASQ